MLTSLALFLQVNAVAVEAWQYSIKLDGPMYAALIDWFDADQARRYMEAKGPHQIVVTIADERMRCDTAHLVSVAKERDWYCFLDHRTKEALLLSHNAGKDVACSTTPFWPEAHGDKSSFEALQMAAALMRGQAESGEPDDVWFYFKGNDGYVRSTTYRVSGKLGAAIPNLHFSMVAGDGKLLDVHWRARHDYGGSKKPRVVLVPGSYFSVPADYTTYLASRSDAHAGATVIDRDRVAQFLSRFPIHEVLPRTLLPGDTGEQAQASRASDPVR